VIRRRTRRNIALLGLLAILSWLGARDRSEPRVKPFDDLDTRLNYALWDFNAQLLNEKGQVNFQIDAPSLRNNASSQIGTLENPRIRIQQEADEWYITADSAIITADREHVSLIGNVDLQRENLLSHDTLEINTRDVLFKVTPRTASTDAAVTIAQNGDHLEAVGMTLDMKTDSYELLQKVQARYDATP
jgi:LPS export ABC transporter protein LptC